MGSIKEIKIKKKKLKKAKRGKLKNLKHVAKILAKYKLIAQMSNGRTSSRGTSKETEPGIGLPSDWNLFLQLREDSFNLLQKVVAENWSHFRGLNLSHENIEEVSLKMEQKALLACMQSHIYQLTINLIISEIRRATEEKKLHPYLDRFLNGTSVKKLDIMRNVKREPVLDTTHPTKTTATHLLKDICSYSTPTAPQPIPVLVSTPQPIPVLVSTPQPIPVLVSTPQPIPVLGSAPQPIPVLALAPVEKPAVAPRRAPQLVVVAPTPVPPSTPLALTKPPSVQLKPLSRVEPRKKRRPHPDKDQITADKFDRQVSSILQRLSQKGKPPKLENDSEQVGDFTTKEESEEFDENFMDFPADDPESDQNADIDDLMHILEGSEDEGPMDLDTRISRIQNGVPDLDTRINRLQNGVPDLDTRISRLQNGVPDLDTRISQIQNGVPNLDTRISRIKNGVSDLPFNYQATAVTSDLTGKPQPKMWAIDRYIFMYKVMAGTARMSARRYCQTRDMFLALFGDDSDDEHEEEFMDREKFVANCSRRVLPTVTKYLMPYYSQRRIPGGSIVFKHLVRRIADSLVDIKDYPSDRDIRDFVRKFFPGKQVYKDFSDVWCFTPQE